MHYLSFVAGSFEISESRGLNVLRCSEISRLAYLDSYNMHLGCILAITIMLRIFILRNWVT